MVGKRTAWWIKRGVDNPSKIPEFNEKIRKTLSKKRKGENNPAWRGDKVGYKSLHQWIQRKKGIAKVCSRCGLVRNKRNVGWANIDHKYKRDLNDWIALCFKCHLDYDMKMGLRKIKRNKFGRWEN